MNLLDNELVRKYFGDCFYKNCPMASTITHKREPCMAHGVLSAMQQPIRKGERYLGYFFITEEWQVDDAPQNNNDPFHPAMLRLPDAFQKQEKHNCEDAKLLMETHIRVYHSAPAELSKPAPPEKCECYDLHIPGVKYECEHHYPKPQDAVEERLQEFLTWIGKGTWGKIRTLREVETEVRDLVRLARETK